MEKIKKWRQVLIAALSVLFATTLLAAIFMITPYRAFAQEVTLTLPENTATYTIGDVKGSYETNAYTVQWNYDENVNIWSVSSPTDIRSDSFYMTATVTKSGTVAFEYLIEYEAIQQYNANENEGNFLSSRFIFTVTPKEGAEGRETEIYYGLWGELENHEWEQISFPVEVGDIIKFEIEQKASLISSGQSGETIVNGYMNWYLHGLGDIANEIAEQYSPAKAQAASLSEVAMISNEITPQTSGTWNMDTKGEYYAFPEVFTGPNFYDMDLTHTHGLFLLH